MKQIKFDTLKDRAATIVISQKNNMSYNDSKDFLCIVPALSSGINPKDLRAEWYDEAVKIIDGWDVRNVKKLIDAFPSIVPKNVLKSTVNCFYDESGNWIVTFGNSEDL